MPHGGSTLVLVVLAVTPSVDESAVDSAAGSDAAAGEASGEESSGDSETAVEAPAAEAPLVAPGATPSAVPPAPEPTEATAREEVDAGRRDIQIGLDGGVTFSPRHVAYYTYGLNVRYTLTRHLSIGLAEVSLAAAELGAQMRWALSGGPFVEMHDFFTEELDAYLQVGIPLQARFGAGIEPRYGAAPYFGAGVRWWVSPLWSVGALSRLHYVSTDGYLVIPRVLPRESFFWTVGLSTEIHL
jgi:hypothetical protein